MNQGAGAREPTGLRRQWPLWVLLAEIVVLYLVLATTGGLVPKEVPDTRSYVAMAKATELEEILSSYRTYGYPLYLKIVAPPYDTFAAVPIVQLAAYWAAVVLFWWALAAYCGSGVIALLAATPLIWGRTLTLVTRVAPDTLGLAFALATVSLALLAAARPERRILWVGLAAATLCSYQVRPSYLFLIAWVPVTAAILLWCAQRVPRARLIRVIALVALATFVPYLLYAGLRSRVVGHFGLVSFGAMNLAGVTNSFLDERMVVEMPPEHRKLAGGMLQKRVKGGFVPYTLESRTEDFYDQYSKNIFRRAVASAEWQIHKEKTQARRQAAESGEPYPEDRWLPGRVETNRRLKSFALAQIRLRPELYSKWVQDSFGLGLKRAASDPWVAIPALAYLLGLPVLVLRGRSESWGERADVPFYKGRLGGLAFLAGAYFVPSLLLVVLVSYPHPRYVLPGYLFVAPVLIVLAVETWRQALAAVDG